MSLPVKITIIIKYYCCKTLRGLTLRPAQRGGVACGAPAQNVRYCYYQKHDKGSRGAQGTIPEGAGTTEDESQGRSRPCTAAIFPPRQQQPLATAP